MTEAQPIAIDRDGTGRLSIGELSGPDRLPSSFSEHRSRSDDPLLVAAVVESSDQEKCADGRRQAGEAAGEHTFQPFGQRQRCIRRRVKAGRDRPGQLGQPWRLIR
jgi:hypothetical protein